MKAFDMDFALTGLGIVSALGTGVAETERNLFAGDTGGMKPLDGLVGGDRTVFGFVRGEAASAAPTAVGRLLDAALAQLDLDALRRAVDPARVGIVLGTSNSTMEEFTASPDRIDMAYPAEFVKARGGFGGPAWCVSTACSSSAKVFASARRLLADGLCDAVVVGGADAYTRTVVEGFHALEAVSPNLTRPLCADRDGINLGEGAALFVLRRADDLDDAARRGAVLLLGVGESSDAYHLTAPDPEGKGAEAAMRAALADAGLAAADVDYVNLHGTGTTYNDAMECAAVRRVFCEGVAASSTKPLTGHCLGAAGAVEAALCWIALRRGRGLPPHVAAPVDRALAPFRIPSVGDATVARAMLSNSFAFGGSNATVVLGVR
jgi:3-oxoacyl-[acyl-carrier-protein] synthase I